ncbi:MAG: hypothetical protein HYZ37_14860 [Candidatus Solibacter usitatus]|nr:hypothetical protein [Candidatus Solibacter usitatus]
MINLHNRTNLKAMSATVVALVLVSSLIAGSGIPIGVALAKGGFVLDQAAVTGTGTVFEGSVLESGKATPSVQLKSGTVVTLGADTKARFHQKEMVLESGSGQAEGGKGFTVTAGGLRVHGESGLVLVRRDAGGSIAVSALRNPARVTTAQGRLVAMVGAGKSLQLAPMAIQEGRAMAPSRLTGVLVFKNGHYYLTDETAGVTVELQGVILQEHTKAVGARVEVTGITDPTSSPASGASEVLRVSKIVELSKSDKEAAVVTAAAHGIGKTAIVAGVVVSVVAAGAGIGLTRTAKAPISN